MADQIVRSYKASLVRLCLTVTAGLFLLLGCAWPAARPTEPPALDQTNTVTDAPPSATPAPPDPSPAPSSTAAERPAPSPTTAPTETAKPTETAELTLTPFPRSLEAYGMVFNPSATPKIPLRSSISMVIWDQEIPATPVDSTPQIGDLPVPPGLTIATSGLLEEAGCEVIDRWGQTRCDPSSPLSQLACDEINEPQGVYFNSEADLALVGECRNITESWLAEEEEALFLKGCAFRRKIGFIFRMEDVYFVLDRPEEMQDFFAPIESTSEAFSYAQLMTGLRAVFDINRNPYQLFFKETVENFRIEETDSGYLVWLYQSQSCFCEPWITSEVFLDVSQDGTVTWLDAFPVSMTTGFGCAD
jgi:hypothetical protein